MRAARELLKDLKYEVLSGSIDVNVSELVYNTRKVKKECMFVCIKGATFDSHDVAGEAAKNGAVVIVAEHPVDVPAGTAVVLVEDTRYALALISAAYFGYPAKKLKVIGITGTKGKTTTTFMIRSILEHAGISTGLIGTIEVIIGDKHIPAHNTTPESYEVQEYFAQMVAAGCKVAVMEVSSQGLKLHRTAGIRFDIGIFTNLAPDHIGENEHASFEEYLYYKTRLLNMCGIGLVNKDDKHAPQIIKAANCELYTYSEESKEADFVASDIRYVSQPDFVGTEFHISGKYDMEVRLGIPGLFNVVNALAAVSVCSFLGLDQARISHALENIRVNGRMEIVYTSERCTVLVDYAHNAVSMESLLSTLRDYKPKRLVCVFGCGGNRSKDRRYSMGEIGGKMADLSIITADNSRYEKVEDIIADIRGSIEKTGGKFIEIPDRREAIRYSILHAQPGDMVAVIGKGHEDYQEINGVRHHFLDREVIEETVKELGEKA